MLLPGLCSPAAARPDVTASLDLVLVLNPPAKLVASWAVMVAAMMSPLLLGPLRHLRDRSFTTRRARSTVLFLLGYGTAWLAGGVALQSLALASHLGPLQPVVPLGVAVAVALLWQFSPAKQQCLNACHRRPSLAAFSLAADLDAFGFGLTNGVACVGACWAMMLLPLLATRGHVLAMVCVALFLAAERLERPAPLTWRWRGPRKAFRIIMAQACMRLAPQASSGRIVNSAALGPHAQSCQYTHK
jgi:predicted metal-binding membrane protein